MVLCSSYVLWLLTLTLLSFAWEEEDRAHHRQLCSNIESMRRVYQFKSNDTAIENIATRSNGHLLFTMRSPVAQVYELDPGLQGSEPILVADSPMLASRKGAYGIVEIESDIFAVLTGNMGIEGSFNVHLIRYKRDGALPTITIAASVSNAVALNGLVKLESENGAVLAGDSVQGVIYKINTATGNSEVVIDDPSMKATSPTNYKLGINGMKMWDNQLFFINSNHATMYKGMLNAAGTRAGPITFYANTSFSQRVPDDFGISHDGRFIVAGSDQVWEIAPDDQKLVIDPQSKDALGASSIGFGRPGTGIMYVAAAGRSIESPGESQMEPGFIHQVNYPSGC